MATDTDIVIFTGSGDDGDCFRFICSVQELATKHGKQNDVTWITKCVSVRMDGKALAWFDTLDDDTKSDWKKLRRAIVLRFDGLADQSQEHNVTDSSTAGLVFGGGLTATERQAYVNQLLRHAVNEGRADDFDWIKRQFQIRLKGGPLSWFFGLPPTVRNDWPRLEWSIITDYPNPPTHPVSPAHILIENWYRNWYSPIGAESHPSLPMSKEEWLAKAEERRAAYEELKDDTIPCWLLIHSQTEIPSNAVRTGTDSRGDALYSARTWYEHSGLVVGKCGRHLNGCHIPLNKKDIRITPPSPFEILVGAPYHFKWASIQENVTDTTSVPPQRLVAVEAGYEPHGQRGYRPFFISRSKVGKDGWHPGKIGARDAFCFVGLSERERVCDNPSMLVWADRQLPM